jgi:hypothetical protein
VTPEQAQLLLPVIEAYAKGKVVQWGYANNPRTIWNDYNPAQNGFDLGNEVHFFNPTLQWRIKPEPPREWWACMSCWWFNRAFVSGNPVTCWNCDTPLVRVREVLPDVGAQEVLP